MGLRRSVRGEREEQDPDGRQQQADQRQLRIRPGWRCPIWRKPEGQRSDRHEQNGQVHQRPDAAGQAGQGVRPGIGKEQQRLKDNETRRPDRGGPAEQWQHHPANERLQQKEKQGTDKRRRAEQERDHLAP